MSKCRCQTVSDGPSRTQWPANPNTSAVCIQKTPSIYQRCTHCGLGRDHVPDGQIARFLNNSSRGPVSALESVVSTVNSVAELLNSTHYAIYNSVRAVMSTVEEFNKLKTQISNLLSAVALLNWIKHIWRLLLSSLRTRGSEELEKIWLKMQLDRDKMTMQLPSTLQVPSAFRGIHSVLFWLFAIGAYLIYKLFVTETNITNMDKLVNWTADRSQYYRAKISVNGLTTKLNINFRATDDYKAQEDDKLSFKRNDILRIAPEEYQPQKRGYLLASTENGKKVGLVPMNCIRLLN